ncbi:ABC transporter permease subunit [Evtepia sp.]|uniref:ABC transporter permease subunit n=1 Tax=Evtepia sp. TaxID=2773933 RepID=UPI002E76CB6C|nr:ABC transporter permease subunit [Evtepia sp.]MEE0748209.1 ABC transporter permease subunit [Evtepia sp.]
MKRKSWELKLIFLVLVAVFAIFLAVPAIRLLLKSFLGEDGLTGAYYLDVFSGKGFTTALGNSFAVSIVSALVAVGIAFVMAYIIHYTRLPRGFKRFVQAVATLPMFLPTITYGFAIIYSFGKQGLITRLLGHQFFDIYGFGGLLVGYVIYTVPVAFLLIHNTMGYVDKKTLVVSKAMGDGTLSTFWIAILRPLLGTLAGAFIQSFFLCFTDFGIPASVGGDYDVIATVLYNEMLGGVPDFNRGAVISVVMLLPSIVSILLLRFLERYNIRYDRISDADLRRNPGRDTAWGLSGAVVSVLMLSLFVVIFVVPLVERWPYQTGFTLEHFQEVFADNELQRVYLNSLVMALATALFGTLAAYGAALITARSQLPGWCKQVIDSIALVTNTIPGMVLGLAFLFAFSGTSLQNTLPLMILCNIVHYFSTPYLMMKNSLSKMNAGWETTAMLMGDSWPKTILRVVTPNAAASLIETFSYYFINAMVTISALIFLAGARTMVVTTKIKQLQYINEYDQVFVLSLLILATNLVAKAVFTWLAKKSSRKGSHTEKKRKEMKAS